MRYSSLFEEYLTAKFNQEYYAQRLSTVKTRNRSIDMFLALFAGGSGVAALGIWQLPIGNIQAGKILFSGLVGVALIASILKPYLKFDDEIERLASIEGTYSTIAHQLEDLIRDARPHQNDPTIPQTRFKLLRAIRGSQEAKEDKPILMDIAKLSQSVIRKRHADKVARLNDLRKEENGAAE